MDHLVLKCVNAFVIAIYGLQSYQAPRDNYFNYTGLSEVVSLLLLFSITLIVVITPLALLGCWIYYSREYVKKFRHNKDLAQLRTENALADHTEITESYKVQYSKTYSRMFGFGLSIIAYGISSNVYMFLKFGELREALINYFSFPFRLFQSLKVLEKIPANTIPLQEVWSAMLLIVAISAAVFFIGYFVGKIIVTTRLGEKPQAIY
jgi:hypothetical protein